MEEIILNNGVKIPAIGVGTFPMTRWTIVRVINQAIYIGYKCIDTASAYANERAIGIGLKLNLKKRRDIFVTTKLSNYDQRKGDIEGALKKSLKMLGLKYVDLYLMHWPNPDTYLDSWLEMEKLYEKGLVRAIGVCNFHEHHLNELLKVASVVPAVNQVELHPLLSQKKLLKYCKEKEIQVQAYSPLARMNKKLVENKTLIKLSNKYNKTVPQIILRWNYQNGIITIPKTENKDRLIQNKNIFDFMLSKKEMKEIDDINENFRVRHNPDTCDYSKL